MLPTPLFLRLAARLRTAWADRTEPPDDDPGDFEARDASARRSHRRLRLARKMSLNLIIP